MAASLQRDQLFADRSLVGTVFCRAYARRVDEWLQHLYEQRVGDHRQLALVATGGYGRGTLSPQSDLDLMLLHGEMPDDELADITQKLWYPIWDEGIKLGHSARTVKGAIELSKSDLDTATSLINARLLAGSEVLMEKLRERSRHQWRKQASKWLPVLADDAHQRLVENGEVAFLLEPDLKESAGGLRDVNAIHWAIHGGVEVLEPEKVALREANEKLLAARVELHRSSNRASNRLLLEEQDPVAEALGHDDADQMMREISAAGRTISFLGAEVWARARRKVSKRFFFFGPSSKLRQVASGVLLQGDTMMLLPNASPTEDPQLLLRLMVTAAQHRARIGWPALDRLATIEWSMPEPWPESARQLFAELLLEGEAAIPVVEAVDQFELFTKLLPEWEPSRCKPQRNAYHRFTVDRHLLEAAAEAAKRVDRVDRPDLLVVGALLHDIGKGFPGDHTEVGIDLVDVIGRRMGYPEDDIAALVAMVEHHLLLPDVATRRDIEDIATIKSVAQQVGSIGVLRLLGALTESDSIATGPSAWSSWKAGLVRDLVRRTEHHLAGGRAEDLGRTFPTSDQIALMRTRESMVYGDMLTLTAIVPDGRGIFSKTVGALAINGLDVMQANVHTEDDMALHQVLVSSSLSGDIDWQKVVGDVRAAHDDELAIDELLEQRARIYQSTTSPAPLPIVTTSVTVDNVTAVEETIIEVAAPDGIGLLYRITRCLASFGLGLQQAKIQTLGDHVVDSFYVQTESGTKVDDASLAEIKSELYRAISQQETTA